MEFAATQKSSLATACYQDEARRLGTTSLQAQHHLLLPTLLLLLLLVMVMFSLISDLLMTFYWSITGLIITTSTTH